MNLKVTQVYWFKSIYNILHNRLRLDEMLSNDRPAVGFGSAQIELRDDGIWGWASISQSLPIAYLTIYFLAADLVAQEVKRKKLREVKSKEWSRWKRSSKNFALTRQQQLLQTSFESDKGTINYRNYSCFHWWEIINKANRLTSDVLYRTIGEGNLI